MDVNQATIADHLFSATAQRASGLESLGAAALQRGIDRFMNKDYAGAAAEFKRSMGLGRNASFAADAAHYLALAYLQMDDLPQAEAAYKSALQIDGQRDDLRVKLGNLYHSQKRYEEAMREYAEAVRINPSAPNRYALGQAYIELGRFGDAESQYAEIQRITPREAGGYLGMGQTLSRQGRHAEAIAQFEEAVARDPGLYAAYAEIGYSRADLGEMEGAQRMVDHLEKAGQAGLADTLSRYMYKVDPPKMVFALSTSSFRFSMGKGTPVLALDAYLLNAGAVKTFNIKIQFDKQMDRESIEDPANWTIARSAGAGPGQAYNFGMRIPETEVRINPTPEAVTWDEKNLTATVFFSIRQNDSMTGTIDPSHLEFSFRGKDIYGLAMDPKADQFCGFTGVA